MDVLGLERVGEQFPVEPAVIRVNQHDERVQAVDDSRRRRLKQLDTGNGRQRFHEDGRGLLATLYDLVEPLDLGQGQSQSQRMSTVLEAESR